MRTRVMILGGCALAGGLLLSSIVPAYAADLTGLDAGIITAQHGLPGAIGSAADDFESPGKTDLAGRTLATGQQWSASTDFEVTGGVAQGTKNNLGLSIATLPWVSIPTTRVTAQITAIGAAEFGLLLQADRDTNTGVALRLLDTGDVTLARLEAGSWITLATTSGATTGTWSLTYSFGTYSAILNGSTLLTYTASPAEQVAWLMNGDVGLFVAGPKGKDAAWADFIVETP